MKDYTKRFSKWQRKQSWRCPNCQKLNAFWRQQCRKCHLTKNETKEDFRIRKGRTATPHTA